MTSKRKVALAASRRDVEREITAGGAETLLWLRNLLPRINQRVAAYIVGGVERQREARKGGATVETR